MALLYAAKASRFISVGGRPISVAGRPNRSIYPSDGAKIGLFAEARYRGKTGAVASPVPKRAATAWVRLAGRGSAFAANAPEPRVLTVIEENPSLHRGNTRWRDIIQAVTLKA